MVTCLHAAVRPFGAQTWNGRNYHTIGCGVLNGHFMLFLIKTSKYKKKLFLVVFINNMLTDNFINLSDASIVL